MLRTEKEKMLAGDLYDASDPLLSQERRKARDLIHRLNVAAYGDPSAYQQIIADLLPNVASDICIEPPFFCDYGYNIHAGEQVYFNFNCVLLDVMPIRIGANVLFGPHVQIYTATHPLDAVERRKRLESAKPIAIGDDCWIGGGGDHIAGRNDWCPECFRRRCSGDPRYPRRYDRRWESGQTLDGWEHLTPAYNGL